MQQTHWPIALEYDPDLQGEQIEAPVIQYLCLGTLTTENYERIEHVEAFYFVYSLISSITR